MEKVESSKEVVAPKIDLTRDQKMSKQSSELSNLQDRQIREANNEVEVETIPGNRNPKFKIRVLEADGYVHVFARRKHLDTTGKNFVHEDRTIMIHKREFDTRVKDGAFATYDEVEIVHDPRKGAPQRYNFKPDQINVDGATKKNDAVLMDTEAAKQLDERAAALDKRENELSQNLGAAQKAIEERNQDSIKRMQEAERLKAEYEEKLKALNNPAPPANESEGKTIGESDTKANVAGQTDAKTIDPNKNNAKAKG
jgi:hypothetical protein